MSSLKEDIINYILDFLLQREREVRIDDLHNFIAHAFADELNEKCNNVPFEDEMFIDSTIRETYNKYYLTYTTGNNKLINLTLEGHKAASHPKKLLGYLEDKENKRETIMTNKVFIVHGHNQAVKLEVARFIEHLKLEPIILHEQTNLGQTIIEKFETSSRDVNFAIILLTADDDGKSKTETNYKGRARQNVIFEMGYFIGLLSRSHVFMLLEDGVEKPSDLDGIVYNSLSEDWRTNLFKELQACGYKVDPNDLLK